MITYLYVKQHTITGLKYFGKTTKKDPFLYNGSGSYWKNHINKHGKEYIKTLEIWGFDDQELCTEFALLFSKNNNIVNSDEWANLCPENGLDGGITGFSFKHSVETKLKIGNAHRGKTLTLEHKQHLSNIKKGKTGTFKGKKHTEYTKQLLSLMQTGRKHTRTDEYRKKVAEAARKRKKHPGLCPYCKKAGELRNLKRWHYDRCKHKLA